DFHVTGVQTCALPISGSHSAARRYGWHRGFSRCWPAGTATSKSRGVAGTWVTVPLRRVSAPRARTGCTSAGGPQEAGNRFWRGGCMAFVEYPFLLLRLDNFHVRRLWGSELIC